MNQMVWKWSNFQIRQYMDVVSGYESANLDLICASKAARNLDAYLYDISQIQYYHHDVIQLTQG